MKMLRAFFLLFLCVISPGSTFSQAENLDSLLTGIPDDSSKVLLLIDKATSKVRTRPSDALPYAEKALELSREFSLKNLEKKASNLLGTTHYYSGNMSKALKYYKSALKLSQQLKDSIAMSKQISNIAIIYTGFANYPKAIEFYTKGIELDKKIGDSSGIAVKLGNLSAVYYYLQEYDIGLANLFEAYNLNLIHGDKSSLSFNLSNIGLMHFAKKNYDSSLYYYFKALDIDKELNYQIGISNHYTNIANIYSEKGDFKKAIEYYSLSLDINKKTGVVKDIAVNMINIGIMYSKSGKFNIAIDYIHNGISHAEKAGLIEVQKKAYFHLKRIYYETGSYKKSVDYYDKFLLLNDSIMNEASMKQINDLKFLYETEKMEIENKVLKKDNKIKDMEIGRQKTIIIFMALIVLMIAAISFIIYRFNRKMKNNNNKLRELIATKDKFFSIIAHDLKSPLWAVKEISHSMSSGYDVLDEIEKKESIMLMNKSCSQVYALLENLLVWARSQTGRIDYKPDIYELKPIIDNVLELTSGNAARKNITLQSAIQNSLKANIDTNMIITVLRNLVLNAIKFTPEGGNITVKSVREKDDIKVSVIDTGIGISDQDMQKLFRIDVNHTTIGTSEEKGTGLGLILCKEFVEKHGGSISVQSSKDKGSEFSFTLPAVN